MNKLEPFHNQPYLNLETIRKSGVGVKTPVWFVEDGDILYVRTVTNSGKVKRIHNKQHVNIAPCKVDGTPLGDWISVRAREVKEPEIDLKVDHLLDKKYGLMKKMFSWLSFGKGREFTTLELKEGEKNEG